MKRDGNAIEGFMWCCALEVLAGAVLWLTAQVWRML